MADLTWNDLFGGLTWLVALGGLYVADAGLKTWKQQIRGTAEYELARRLLRETYRLREALAQVRFSGMSGSEMPKPESTIGMSEAEKSHYGLAGAYRNRWRAVSEARTSLDAERLEAEVVWDRTIGVTLYLPLFQLQAKLLTNMQNFLTLQDPRISEIRRRALEKHEAEIDEILFDSTQKDAFAKAVDEAILAIEERLRPHLGIR